MIKAKVVKQIPHVYHFHDTNSLASVSGMSLFCLSAPSSSAWSNSKRNVYSTGLGLCVLKHGKAWQGMAKLGWPTSRNRNEDKGIRMFAIFDKAKNPVGSLEGGLITHK